MHTLTLESYLVRQAQDYTKSVDEQWQQVLEDSNTRLVYASHRLWKIRAYDNLAKKAFMDDEEP